VGIAPKVGVDQETVALIEEILTMMQALTVVEVKMEKKETAIAEARMVRDLKEVITVEVKMGKDWTEVVFEKGVVVIIEVVCIAVEAVTEGGVDSQGKNKLTLTSE